MKFAILASASVLALSAGVASAQTAPFPQPPTGPSASQSAPSSLQAPVQGLQDIVVTAQRVEQIAQKAPVPITVVSSAELTREAVTRPEDLSRVVPELIAANSGGANTTFFLRGVGNFTVNSYSDPSIAFNVDGVYIGRPTSTTGFFYDLQRVEVLNGPQGTLYGRNATGGAINVIPNKPVMGQYGADLEASYGNYNALQTQGSINVPIGDRVALRVSGTYDAHDGYLSDGTSDQREYAVRAQMLFDLLPNLTTRIAADYEYQGGAGQGASQLGSVAFTGTGYTFTPAPGLNASIGLSDPRTEAYLQTRFVSQVGRLSEPLGTYPFQDNGGWGISDETNWITPVGTVTVEAAHRENVIDTLFTAPDFRASLTNERDNQTSVEARLAGKFGKLVDYIFGGYYFDEHIRSSLSIDQLTLTPFENFTTGTQSEAAFAHFAVHATNAITFTLAGRYTSDRKTFDGVSNNYILFCGNPAPPQDFCPSLPLLPFERTAAQLVSYYQALHIPVSTVPLGPAGLVPPNTPTVFNAVIPIDAVTTTNKFTYRLAAEWQLAPRSMIYASYETGFHGGGFSFAEGLESYKPETIDAYTIGSKNRFFDNRLQINLELFDWLYKNQQFSEFGYDLATPPNQVFYTTNVGKSTNKGADIDMDYLLTPDTRLNGSVQYLDARYDNFIYYAPTGGLPPNVACPYAPTTHNGISSYAINCSGRPGFNAPTWSFNVGAQQTFHLGDAKIILQGGTRYRGDFYVAPGYQPWLLSKADFESDASLTYSPGSDRWFVSGYVNNIEDNRRVVQASTNGGLGTVTAITTAPRTYGVRVGARF